MICKKYSCTKFKDGNCTERTASHENRLGGKQIVKKLYTLPLYLSCHMFSLMLIKKHSLSKPCNNALLLNVRSCTYTINLFSRSFTHRFEKKTRTNCSLELKKFGQKFLCIRFRLLYNIIYKYYALLIS